LARNDLASESFSDQQLLKLLAGGSRESYTIIYKRYSELLFRHACSMLDDRTEAEDVIQEVFMMLWTKRAELIAARSLSAYLYSSVRNRILNHITHQKVIDRYINSLRAHFESGGYTTDERLLEKELAAVIEKEIKSMPPKMQEIFLMSREQHLSHRDIGALLNISDKTVKQQVYKAVKQLKDKIGHLLRNISVLNLFY
jgi:RNA polymerase sigma-70 factor, ECF subfamily